MTRVAVIGAGVMGAVQARACAELPDVTVAWIADQDQARAQAIAGELGARATTDNLTAITGDVDAVIVTVPTPFHRAVTELAAAYGKHVFCEKPIARTLDDAEAMVAACERAGVRFMVGHVCRFFPEFVKIRDVLQTGTLGQIGLVRASRVSAHPPAERGWFANLAASGGMIVDLMIHDFDTLRWYFGDVERVFAHGLSYTPYQPTSDYALVVLRFANGVIAHVEGSWAHGSWRTAMEIVGEHGIVRHAGDGTAPIQVERPGPTVQESVVARYAAANESPYQTELRHFFARLADGTPFETEGREGVRALEIALAALASVRTGRPIQFVDGRVRPDEIREEVPAA
ncbi:MAG: UDP-N-acetylglucosamine 3-dehydrogenase [Thermomicrobiales bacterium]|nr:UDP-N-acetylglucosamine 3-dehydrogenase [Thermomicrobiales bacterium]